MTGQTIRLNTIGRIADRLGVPVHRVRHIVATRDHINHCAVAGNAHLYDSAAIAQIRYALNAIDARRGVSQ